MAADQLPTASITTGLDASEELVSFLERFFDEINDDAAQAYTYAAAHRDGELVGVAATSTPADADYRKIAFLHVAEDHQCTGVASALVDEIRAGTERDELLAKAHVGWAKANRFYRKTGWHLDRDRSSGMLNAYVLNCRTGN